MDFALSEEQIMLRDGAARYLRSTIRSTNAADCFEREAGFSESQWRQFADMGWLALPVPRIAADSGVSDRHQFDPGING